MNTIHYLALTVGNVLVVPPKGIPSNGLSDGGNYSLTNILTTGISYLLAFAAIIALFYLIFGGYKWMTSGGNQQAITAARQQIIYAMLGLLIAFAAFIIIGAIGHTFGGNLF